MDAKTLIDGMRDAKAHAASVAALVATLVLVGATGCAGSQGPQVDPNGIAMGTNAVTTVLAAAEGMPSDASFEVEVEGSRAVCVVRGTVTAEDATSDALAWAQAIAQAPGADALEAVTVKVEADGAQAVVSVSPAALPPDADGLGERLAGALGYALDEGAYEAVRDMVTAPTGGEEPCDADGRPLVASANPAS